MDPLGRSADPVLLLTSAVRIVNGSGYSARLTGWLHGNDWTACRHQSHRGSGKVKIEEVIDSSHNSQQSHCLGKLGMFPF